MKKTLVGKIWLGLLPLSILYWGFAVGGAVIWKVLFNFVDDNNSIAVNSFLFLALVYQLFVTVGVWRAASTYEKSALLALIAKIATTIGTVILLITLLGFSKLKTIQNDMHSETYSNYKQSDKNYDHKTTNDGMSWISMDDGVNTVWYGKNIKKSKFNILDLWVKLEIKERAKLHTPYYSHTLIHFNIDCDSSTYNSDYAADILNFSGSNTFNSTAGFGDASSYKALTESKLFNKYPLFFKLINEKCKN